MQTLIWNTLNEQEKQTALARPAQTANAEIKKAVTAIKQQVAEEGDEALFALSEKFDKVKLYRLEISAEEIAQASTHLPFTRLSGLVTSVARKFCLMCRKIS